LFERIQRPLEGEPAMFTTLVASRGPRFWLPFVAAVSMATFVVGMATGSGLLRGPGTQDIAARGGVAGVSITRDAQISDVRPHSMSSAAWEALYGPTAATWGVSDVRPRSMSSAAWEALYGPTAATWGVADVRPRP
jgi:hypothetical protein